jgi:hypothetical protein
LAAAKNETDEKTSRDKFITCVVFAGVDTKLYGRLKTELNNAYVAGQNKYLKTVESEQSRRVLCRSIRRSHATNVARRATVQANAPVGTAMMMSCQLDQIYD